MNYRKVQGVGAGGPTYSLLAATCWYCAFCGPLPDGATGERTGKLDPWNWLPLSAGRVVSTANKFIAPRNHVPPILGYSRPFFSFIFIARVRPFFFYTPASLSSSPFQAAVSPFWLGLLLFPLSPDSLFDLSWGLGPTGKPSTSFDSVFERDVYASEDFVEDGLF